MLPLDAPVFSHLSLREREQNKRGSLTPWSRIAADSGYVVESFTRLNHAVHWIAYKNRRFNLFFRGQDGDHGRENPAFGRTTILATLFRAPPGAPRLEAAEHRRRIARLRHYREQFRGMEERPSWRTLWKYKEARWALLQHYEVCPTPLLDITHSLAIAATFALWRPGRTDRFVYAFGLPYPTGSITLSTADDLLLLNLRSLMPPDARRPHFQEGFLVGSSPKTTTFGGEHDLAVRMLAKFRIPGDAIAEFWRDSVPPLPKRYLMPEDDPVKGWVEGLGRR